MINRDKTARADAVLAVLEVLLKETSGPQPDLLLEMYANGREHGYSLVEWKVQCKVSFSENRNSDQIVVYCGHSSLGFELGGSIPSEEVYHKAQYFDSNDYLKAARHILAYFQSALLGEQLKTL